MTVADAEWLVEQHRQLYTLEAGFDHTFGDLVRDIVADFMADHDPIRERAMIAVKDDRRLGSIFCVRQDQNTSKLRLFLLVPGARGLGLGHMLLTACMDFARQSGYTRMVLWTHKSHVAACALYARHGFRLTDEQPVHSFGVDLISQNWEINL